MHSANLLAFYRTVADQSPLPVIIYNFPQATGYDIPAEVVIELANHPNIAAIKESSGNLDKVRAMVDGTRHIKRTATVTETFAAVTPRMLRAAERDAAQKQEKESRELVSIGAPLGRAPDAESVERASAPVQHDHSAGAPPAAGTAPSPSPSQHSSKPSSSAVSVVGTLKTRPKEVGFQVMVGAAHQLEPSLALGAVGAILALACPAPTACFEIYAALKEGDTVLAREKQERVKLPAQRVVSELGVPGVKYAMDLNGYYGGPARLPFLPLTGEQKAEIEKLLTTIRN